MSASSAPVLSSVVTSTPIWHANEMAARVRTKNILPKLPATKLLVDEAFEALHSRRGVSLRGIKKYIGDSYGCVVSHQRYLLIKSYIRELQATGEVINVTGKCLVGRLRRVPKRRATKKRLPQSTFGETEDTVAANGMTTPTDQSTRQLQESLHNAPAADRDPLAHTNSILNLENGDTPRTSMRGRPMKRPLLPPVGNSQIYELEKLLSPVAKRRKTKAKRPNRSAPISKE